MLLASRLHTATAMRPSDMSWPTRGFSLFLSLVPALDRGARVLGVKRLVAVLAQGPLAQGPRRSVLGRCAARSGRYPSLDWSCSPPGFQLVEPRSTAGRGPMQSTSHGRPPALPVGIHPVLCRCVRLHQPQAAAAREAGTARRSERVAASSRLAHNLERGAVTCGWPTPLHRASPRMTLPALIS